MMEFAGFFWFLKVYLIFLTSHAVCRILVPGPGIERVRPAAEAQSLNHWTTREVSYFSKEHRS